MYPSNPLAILVPWPGFLPVAPSRGISANRLNWHYQCVYQSHPLAILVPWPGFLPAAPSRGISANRLNWHYQCVYQSHPLAGSYIKINACSSAEVSWHNWLVHWYIVTTLFCFCIFFLWIYSWKLIRPILDPQITGLSTTNFFMEFPNIIFCDCLSI